MLIKLPALVPVAELELRLCLLLIFLIFCLVVMMHSMNIIIVSQCLFARVQVSRLGVGDPHPVLCFGVFVYLCVCVCCLF